MSDISWHSDKKWDILLPFYYTTQSILELYAFFSLHDYAYIYTQRA